MTKKEHKLMVDKMRAKYVKLSSEVTADLAFILANSYGKGWYESYKKQVAK